MCGALPPKAARAQTFRGKFAAEVEQRIGYVIQLAYAATVHDYALAPAGCAPSCSAEDNISSEKEKSHSFELVLALFVRYLTSIIEKVHTPLVCARLL